MALRINSETRWVELEDNGTVYSWNAVAGIRLVCPDCGGMATPGIAKSDSIANGVEGYRVTRRWSCVNGHGSPNSL